MLHFGYLSQKTGEGLLNLLGFRCIVKKKLPLFLLTGEQIG